MTQPIPGALSRSRASLLAVLVALGLTLGVAATWDDSASAAPAASLSATAAPGPPRLGSDRHLAPYGEGWGRREPRLVDNGGAPSGIVTRLQWSRWGQERSRGRGLTYLYKADGGYYERKGRITLRAQRLGRCGDQRAYERLYFRIAERPGQPVTGRWRVWGGGSNLCR